MQRRRELCKDCYEGNYAKTKGIMQMQKSIFVMDQALDHPDSINKASIDKQASIEIDTRTGGLLKTSKIKGKQNQTDADSLWMSFPSIIYKIDMEIIFPVQKWSNLITKLISLIVSSQNHMCMDLSDFDSKK